MPMLFALALSVGVLAVVDTWLFVGPLATTALAGLVWIPSSLGVATSTPAAG